MLPASYLGGRYMYVARAYRYSAALQSPPLNIPIMASADLTTATHDLTIMWDASLSASVEALETHLGVRGHRGAGYQEKYDDTVQAAELWLMHARVGARRRQALYLPAQRFDASGDRRKITRIPPVICIINELVYLEYVKVLRLVD